MNHEMESLILELSKREPQRLEDEKKRIERGEKATIQYIICDECGQKFEPFYFSGPNEYGITNHEKIDDCPACRHIVIFSRQPDLKSKYQNIQIFEYLYSEEIEQNGIIAYEKRPSDIERVLKSIK